MNEIYYGTKTVRRVNNSTIIHFEKWWGFEKGELVNLGIRRLDSSGTHIKTVKKVCIVGNSLAIYLDRDWGFDAGDVVVIEMSKMDSDEVDGDDAAGSGAEEADKELSG